MNENPLKAAAILSFLFEAIMLVAVIGPDGLLYAESRVAGALSLARVARLSLFFFLVNVVGVGLLYRRKWAAICFYTALLAIALWLILGSLLSVPFPWNLFNITLGFALTFPIVTIVRAWPMLSWRG
jgi:hypothetical protein